ncbi:hypothetical protein Kpol_1032p38 [Vanderwaltozyma polyspora DSM 70294]|uniref:RecA family profile 1 domain-containing protein n=1 Tax=Vanderwaltozyma polyspora (strain ATCC 22028 / DSM 70294 / BCRC 21397 / CBS 2163 / NBRC 10782 / NRRL Y-8283 / UCD 57-17) TaxID=436907 RepID=A7TGZ2_VANPO|nr:uncharacterized protein Kpol_1032p38 [Vanderwaltozyma polyspora DSM 70294]EDO18444.1 hypothetical protein Kpol_1032p38 [Vanderwaltozyma polyspora DSM 70294]
MSLGISLSQLISSKIEPIKSGIEELDECLEDGFQSRSIYEIYGPPGIGKTRLGLQVMSNFVNDKSRADEKVLWIETYNTLPVTENNFSDLLESEQVYRVEITKITELIVFFNKIALNLEEYSFKLIIIDGFSVIINDHLNNILKRSETDITNEYNLHELKCKRLILLLTVITKYTHSSGSTVLLLDNCMNTAFNTEFNLTTVEDNLEVVDDGSNFFVKNNGANSNIVYDTTGIKRNVQVLKSELVSNVGIGTRDSRWEVFIKARIGMFWDWENKFTLDNKRFKADFSKCRVMIVSNLQEMASNKDKENNDTSFSSSFSNRYSQNKGQYLVKIFPNDDGYFTSTKPITNGQRKKRLISPTKSNPRKRHTPFIDGQSTQVGESTQNSTQELQQSENSMILSIDTTANQSVSNPQDDEVVYDSEG